MMHLCLRHCLRSFKSQHIGKARWKLANRINSVNVSRNGVVVDGFPRTEAQVEYLNQFYQDQSASSLFLVNILYRCAWLNIIS